MPLKKGILLGVLTFQTFLTPPSTIADCASELRLLVGWTVIADTSVEGEFEGCEFGKKFKMLDGSIFTCAEYNYSYSYFPDVIVFGKSVRIQGRPIVLIKLLIEDELYEMEPQRVLGR